MPLWQRGLRLDYRMRHFLFTLVTLCTLAVSAQSQPVAFGFQAGVGGAFPSSSLRDNFDGGVIFTGGLSGSWRRVTMKVDVDYGQPSFNRQNIFDKRDEQGRDAQLNAAASATQFGLNVQLGYSILRQQRLSITPATGFRWTRYSWNVNDIEWSKNDEGLDVFQAKNTSHATLSNLGWMASVAFDIRLHDRYIADAPLLGGQARYTSSLRLTPWVAHAAFSKCSPSVKGWFLGINLTYAGLLSGL